MRCDKCSHKSVVKVLQKGGVEEGQPRPVIRGVGEVIREKVESDTAVGREEGFARGSARALQVKGMA